jgi:HEAT repeat protein
MKKLTLILILVVLLFPCGCIEQQSPSWGKAPASGGNGSYELRNRAIKIVRAALADKNSHMRNRAIEVTSTTGRGELMPIVADLLIDDKPAVRYAAALAVGDMAYTGGTVGAMRAIRSQEVSVQMAAAYALVKLGRGKYSDILSKSAISKDQDIQATAVVLLGRLGDKKHLNLLYELMRDENSSYLVKIQAAEAIANLGDDRILHSKLWPLLISKHADDKIIGIGAMAALGAPDAKNAIMTMLMDEMLEIRLYAAGQLGKLGDVSGTEHVLEYLHDPQFDMDQWSVANETAVIAIGQIGAEELKKFLPKLLDSRNKLMQLDAAMSVLLDSKLH